MLFATLLNVTFVLCVYSPSASCKEGLEQERSSQRRA